MEEVSSSGYCMCLSSKAFQNWQLSIDSTLLKKLIENHHLLITVWQSHFQIDFQEMVIVLVHAPSLKTTFYTNFMNELQYTLDFNTMSAHRKNLQLLDFSDLQRKGTLLNLSLLTLKNKNPKHSPSSCK